jgi:hypothetical protein
MGTAAGIKSECLRVQIGPRRKRLPRGMMRDLFEAGLNEAAGSLAASYGRWSCLRVSRHHSGTSRWRAAIGLHAGRNLINLALVSAARGHDASVAEALLHSGRPPRRELDQIDLLPIRLQIGRQAFGAFVVERLTDRIALVVVVGAGEGKELGLEICEPGSGRRRIGGERSRARWRRRLRGRRNCGCGTGCASCRPGRLRRREFGGLFHRYAVSR